MCSFFHLVVDIVILHHLMDISNLLILNQLNFQESEEEVTDTEQAENWFSLTSAQRICGMSAVFIFLFHFRPLFLQEVTFLSLLCCIYF